MLGGDKGEVNRTGLAPPHSLMPSLRDVYLALSRTASKNAG
jgi:hypothetical protein